MKVSSETASDGRVIIELKVVGTGLHWFALRSHNLQILSLPQSLVTLTPDKPQVLRWLVTIDNLRQRWVALVVPDNDLAQRQEIFGARVNR